MNKEHTHWMTLALERAKEAMAEGELPIASVVVAGGKELLRSSTRTKSLNSIVAHGELFALYDLHEKVFTVARPLTIYTTLEPCVMCLGAAMQCGVDSIIFGMKAAPDGGAAFAEVFRASGQSAPHVIGGVLEKESLELMKLFVAKAKEHPGLPYAQLLVDAYNV